MRKVPLICGVTLLCAASLWQFCLSHRWTQRIPPGWHWGIQFIGATALPDPRTGDFPSVHPPAFYERDIAITSETDRPRAIHVEDRFSIRDSETGKTSWEYILQATVDPGTGKHLGEGLRDDCLVFPRQTEKKTYRLRTNYLKGVPLSFRREERVEGLATYLFEYRGPVEYTESYRGTKQYPGVPLAPTQEIRCADDYFAFRAWVEPLTGEIVKIDESCPSGDYIFDKATGKRGNPVLIWGGVSAGDDVLRRVEAVRAERLRYLWASRYGATALLFLALLMGVAGLRVACPTREALKTA